MPCVIYIFTRVCLCRYGNVSESFEMDEVSCTGSEGSILDCLHQKGSDCNSDEGAGVECFAQGSGTRNIKKLINFEIKIMKLKTNKIDIL